MKITWLYIFLSAVFFVGAGVVARFNANAIGGEGFFGSELKTCVDPKEVQYSELGAYGPTGKSLFLRGVVTEVPLENTDRITIRRSCTLSELDSPKDITEPRISFEGAKALSSGISIGDEVYAQLALDGKTLKSLAIRQIKPSRIWSPVLVTILVMVSLILLLRGLFKSGFRQLCTGKDGRMSNSQTQIAIWFFMLLTTLLTVLIFRVMYTHFRYALGIDIPTNLLVLSGLSMIVFVGARVAKEAQVERNPNIAIPNSDKADWDQLWTSDDGAFDLTDFQMIAVTVVAAFTYFLAFLAHLEIIPFISQTALPDVNGTVLALFGLGQGAYLTRKITDAVTTKTAIIPNFTFASEVAVNQPTFSNLNDLVLPIVFTMIPEKPDGLSFDSATGIISGKPTRPMLATQYTISAKDKKDTLRSQIISITVT